MAGVSSSRLTSRPIALGIAFGVLAVAAAAVYFIALNHGQPIIRSDASAYTEPLSLEEL
jgi:hypothetical protein